MAKRLYDGECVGQYTDFYVRDAYHFNDHMAQGMPLDMYRYYERETNWMTSQGEWHGRKFPDGTTPSTQKNRCIVYTYEVNGYRYFRANTIRYSLDLVHKMMNKPCRVYYDTTKPWISSVSGMNSSLSEQENYVPSLVGMIFGIVSCAFSMVPLIGVILAIVGLVLGIKSLKNQKDNNVFGIAAVSTSGLGILLNLVTNIIFLIMLLAYLTQG